MDKCAFCICKTCAIAESNGGAPGCGNCDICLGTPNQRGVTSCSDYYNPEPRKPKQSNDNLNNAIESQD